MVDERESPSAGWRAVYREMAADPDVEQATHRCPDCDRTCENVLRDVYECEEHGVFRASANDGEETPEASTDETEAPDDVGENATGDAEETDAEETANDPRDEPDDALDDLDEVENRASEPAD